MSLPKGAPPTLDLPPEVLRMCVAHLPGEDQFTTLQVSKEWHDVALPVAWEKVRIIGESKARFILCTLDGTKRLDWGSFEKYSRFIKSVHINGIGGVAAPYGTFSTYESDIWLKIESLPNLQSLTAENYDLLRRVNVRTLKVIFARIRFLTFNSVLNTSPSVVGLLEGNPRWSVEDLSIDCDCGVDVVKFISCCPSLRKLDFRNGTSTDTAKLRGQKGFEDLVTHLKTSANLRYLEDLSILVGEGLTERELVTFLGQVRGCLRRVQFQVQMEVELNILSVLKVHFKTLTDVELTSKVPGISSEIMASCQALTHARLVLFPSDISDKRPWVCKSMISFHIRIPLKNGESSLLERALCLRISDLTQLEYIHLDCSLPGPTATRKLDAGGMDLLLKLTKLKYLNLGRGVFSEIDSSALSWIVKFQGLKQVLAFWEKGSRSKTLKHIDLVKRGD